MKTGQVNTSAPSMDLATDRGAAPEGAADFTALFSQALSGTTPATFAAEGVQLQGQTVEQGKALDADDLAAWIAALVSVVNTPVTPVPQSATTAGLDGIGASREVAHVVHEALTAQLAAAQSATSSTEEVQLESTPATSEAVAAPVDPRAAQGALDSLRDLRTQQLEAPVQRQMHAPVGTRAWTEELGQQIHWMTDRGHYAASLRLSPEHLGPLEIRISIQDDKASVWFGAAHADTRSAIEHALPRLREMLASQGLALNDFGVFKEPPRQQVQLRVKGGSDIEPRPDQEVAAVRTARLGLVDAYA
jgi:flagellar hook-length control protein FliK